MDANKRPLIIGLYSSQAGSGKSEVAAVLCRHRYELVKFAAPLKAMARALLVSMGFTHRHAERMVEGDLKEEVVPGFDTVTPRHLMQTLGTDWGREAISNDLWTKVAISKAASITAEGGRVVIDDMRFPNEFEAIREVGGVTVRIDRPDPSRAGLSRYEGQLDGHEFDVVIQNDGTLADLKARVLAHFDA